MSKIICALLMLLLCVVAGAQQSSAPKASVPKTFGTAASVTGATDTLHGVLLPAQSAEGDAADAFADAPAHTGRTGTLVLLRDQSYIDLPFYVVGEYADLQKILQQRELLFWQIPFWTVVINLSSALILLLVSLKQPDLPLFRWLIACALTGNFYFLPQLAPQFTPLWVSAIGITVWLFLLYKLMQATLLMQSFAARSAPDRSSQMLRYAVLLLMVLFVTDSIFVLMDVTLPNHPGMHPQLVPAGQLLGILAALYFLVSRHAETGMELEHLNASLDQRVKLASLELQERYAQLKVDALDAASMKERKNIYQSIHEDLSDKLLQLIYSATLPETADLARSALSELRDSRNLLPDQNRALEDVLADARSEIQIRCDQANLTLVWQQQNPELPVFLNARQCSALSRTLREAISNLLKHAQAKSACVSISMLSGSSLIYRIEDNGTGMLKSARPGRGLVNMQNRIRELGGALTISAAESGGTILEFCLPIKDGTAESRRTA